VPQFGRFGWGIASILLVGETVGGCGRGRLACAPPASNAEQPSVPQSAKHAGTYVPVVIGDERFELFCPASQRHAGDRTRHRGSHLVIIVGRQLPYDGRRQPVVTGRLGEQAFRESRPNSPIRVGGEGLKPLVRWVAVEQQSMSGEEGSLFAAFEVCRGQQWVAMSALMVCSRWENMSRHTAGPNVRSTVTTQGL
jgi:hypothetical protein